MILDGSDLRALCYGVAYCDMLDRSVKPCRLNFRIKVSRAGENGRRRAKRKSNDDDPAILGPDVV
jgi:hypothetical protein